MRVWNGRLRTAVLGAVVAAALAAVACSPGTSSPPLTVDLAQTPTTTRVPSPTPAPARGAAAGSAAGPSPVAKAERPWQHAVRTSLSGPTASSGRLKTQPGATLALTLESRPTMYRGGVGGNERVIQTAEWTQHDVAEMRFCISTRGTADGRLGPQRVDCALPETWMPFEASRAIPLVVEWIGPGEVMAQAQFRRADGTIVQSITSNYDRVETSSSFFWADSILDPNVPVASLPPSVQAAAAERLAAYPVTGSVKIKNSPCCVGGPAGGTITVPVTFSATSPHGPVTEMQLGAGGCDTSRLTATSGGWEPFTAQRDMPVSLTSGFSTFSVAVQFRDAAGNVSAVHCDSVGTEGMPPPPRP